MSNLQRFVSAQDTGGTYARAMRELAAGSKETHWMWFIFPQIAGLGHSSVAQLYAISSLDEAKAYLAHPVLGPRLVAACETLSSSGELDARQVFGSLDAQKLQSSVTLFLRAAPGIPVFGELLDQCFQGRPDAATEQILAEHAGGAAGPMK
ncbi:DUF1810 domain-containing protein [Arthrobacter sp. TMN-50]